MRTQFGDYRAKMAEEEQTLALDEEKMKFTHPQKKFHFVKKSAILTSDKNFKFNFKDVPASASDGDNAMEGQENKTEVKHTTVLPSDNSFRFNFSVDGQ